MYTDVGGRSMEKMDYMISDASKKVDVEQHTLRYWQDELKLNIKRNGLGHRVYNDEDINTFKKIKQLKENGFQLKTIKLMLPDIDKLDQLDPKSLLMLKDRINLADVHKGEYEVSGKVGENEITTRSNDCDLSVSNTSGERMGQFRAIMKDIMTEALKENSTELSDKVAKGVTNSVIKEMDYLLRMKEEREEERYRKFDKLLREYQVSNLHSAVAKERKRRRHLFGAKKQ